MKVIEWQKIAKKLKILTKNLVNTNFIGTYKSVFKGTGLEFEGYRYYTPLDDAKLIDWKATLRALRPLIRLFAEERNLQVFFLLDISDSMVFGSTQKLKHEYAAELIACLTYTIIKGGDAAGLGMFNDKLEKVIYPSLGERQLNLIIKELANYHVYGGKYDITKALKYTLALLKKRSLLIMVSDFIGVKKEWETYLRIASKKFDILGIMVRDPRDISLPSETHQVVLEDPYSNKQVIIDPTLIKNKYERNSKEQINKIKETFRKANLDFILLTTDKPFIIPLIKFLKRRAKRLL